MEYIPLQGENVILCEIMDRVTVASSLFRYPSYTSSCLDLQSLLRPSKEKYSAINAYGASKLCNLLFALQFHRNNVEHGVYCNAVHPGNLLPTNLTRDSGLMCKAAFAMARPFTKSVVSKPFYIVCSCGVSRVNSL